MALSREKKLARLAGRQFGLFTAKQAVACGYSADNHPYWYRIGQWIHLDKGIYCLPAAAGPEKNIASAQSLSSTAQPGEPNPEARTRTEDELRIRNLLRWLLWSRDQHDRIEAVISHRWALACHGALPWPASDEPLDLRVPKDFRKSPPPGVRLHRGLPPAAEIASLGPLRVTSSACAWRDCAAAGEPAWPAERPGAEAALPAAISGAETILPSAVLCLPPTEVSAGHRSAIMSPERDLSPLVRRRAQAGFTLVELLVVMTIITLLAAMLLPALEKAMSVARKTCCANNERQVGLALQGYSSDYAEYLPVVSNWNAGFYPNYWQRALPPFIDSSAPATSAGLLKVVPVLQCPTHTETFVRLAASESRRSSSTFGMNCNFGPNAQRNYWRRISRFSRPSGTLAITESGYFPVYNSQPQLDGYYLLKGAEMYNSTGVHAGGNNILWLDGHVAWWIDVTRLTLPPYNSGGAENAWSQGFDATQP